MAVVKFVSTQEYNTPYLPPSDDYVFILEDLELVFPEWQLEAITNDWNSGVELDEIARRQRRDPLEVFLALFHQARNRKVTRPFAFIKKEAKHVRES